MREKIIEILREGVEEYTKLCVLDLDGTLIDTGMPESGRATWERVTGQPWPLNGVGKPKGWWSAPESLDIQVFDMPVNQDVYNAYKKAMGEPNTYVVLMTGRLKKKLTDEVMTLLDSKNLTFDEILLNSGGDTCDFKIKEVMRILGEKPTIKYVEFFEDRPQHVQKFEAWGDAGEGIDVKVNYIESGNHE